MLQLLFSGQLTPLQSTSVGVVAGEPQQSQPLLYFGFGIPQGPLLVPQAGMLSGRRFGDVFFTLPQPSVSDSFADQ